MIVPPGMPNTISQPTASSERTSEAEPVTRTGAPPGGAGFGGGPGRGGVAPGTGACREGALVIGAASGSVVLRKFHGATSMKKPPSTTLETWSNEGRAPTRTHGP